MDSMELKLRSRAYSCGNDGRDVTVLMISAAISIPVVSKVVVRFGKRIPFMCFQLALIPTALGLLLIPSRSVVAIFILSTCTGISGSAGFFIPWAMISDVGEDYILQNGRRLDTGFFSMALSVKSLTDTLGQGLTTIALEIGGYKTGACVQPASVGTSLRILVSAFPAVFSLLAVAVIWKYPITEDRRRKTKEELENRRKSNKEENWKECNGHELLHPRNADTTDTLTTSYEEDVLLSPDLDLSVLEDCKESIL
ncbi:sodium-dependent lysophosphatidylcholine symporter 1-like [Branchiostoma floridae]|uniref:Sodium-dependent lysophosphatidylcholine symporter 1-like n=1 Tax=Branchiostoma floridae TaxID=7739 RepID=A0A9J7L639_BRAFL|nr:sodium-dependent lysophosphatidylcholine symporter 1-like [Branchiostoma floridae]